MRGHTERAELLRLATDEALQVALEKAEIFKNGFTFCDIADLPDDGKGKPSFRVPEIRYEIERRKGEALDV